MQSRVEAFYCGSEKKDKKMMTGGKGEPNFGKSPSKYRPNLLQDVTGRA